MGFSAAMLDPWAKPPFYPKVESVSGGLYFQKICTLPRFRFFSSRYQPPYASGSRTLRYPIGLVVVSASPHRPGYFSPKLLQGIFHGMNASSLELTSTSANSRMLRPSFRYASHIPRSCSVTLRPKIASNSSSIRSTRCAN